MASLCPLPLGHLFHSAADIHFPQYSFCCCCIVPVEAFLFPSSLTRISSGLGSLALSLHIQAASAFSWVIHPCFHFCMLLFCAWILSGASFYISLAAFRFYSCLLGWMAPEFRKDNPWKSTSFPGALFFLGMWGFSRQVPGQSKACSSQVQGCSLAICLLHFSQTPHRVMVAAAKAAPASTFWTRSSLLLIIMSSRESLLVGFILSMSGSYHKYTSETLESES